MSLVPNFAGGSDGKCLPTMQKTQAGPLSLEDPLEKEMATHSSTFIRKIPWMEEPGRLQSMGSQRVRHNWANFTFTFGSKTSLLFYLIKFSWDSWQIKTDDSTNLHPLLFLTCTSFHPWTAKKWTMNWHQVFYTVGFYTSQLFLPWRIQFTKAYLEFSPSRSLEAGEKHQLYSNVLFLFTF